MVHNMPQYGSIGPQNGLDGTGRVCSAQYRARTEVAHTRVKCCPGCCPSGLLIPSCSFLGSRVKPRVFFCTCYYLRLFFPSCRLSGSDLGIVCHGGCTMWPHSHSPPSAVSFQSSWVLPRACTTSAFCRQFLPKTALDCVQNAQAHHFSDGTFFIITQTDA